MKIGFYGHSSACWANYPIDGVHSFIDVIVERYNASLVCKGVPQSSEERILFELKKTKDIDLAVIFHSAPKYIFLPTCRRDIGVDDAGLRKALHLWKDKKSDKEVMDAAKDNYFKYGGIKEVFGDIDTFVSTMALHREYLYHPDLQMNRFTGALIQIDQYVTEMKIPTIHIYWGKTLPSWFKFSSGINAPRIAQLTSYYNKSGFPNNISAEGQTIIAIEISKHIDNLNKSDNK